MSSVTEEDLLNAINILCTLLIKILSPKMTNEEKTNYKDC